MTYDILTALVLFALVSSITPGPNNMMLLASGANFGFRRTIPHMLGISIGHMIMVILVGIGLMQVFDLYPVSHTILKVASVGYLLYLAWKIANSAAPDTNNSKAKPFSFLQAALFQWVNPKAWSMALTAITLYAPDRSLVGVASVAFIFAMTNFPSITIWTVLGTKIRHLLSNPLRLKAFNVTMAILLVVSLYPVLYSL
ncbi:MAG: LysE family translocator [Rhodobacterales bacterium]|nr:LysE family translocator [Rhodobacterales bacterium]